jgi:hypothetical protein
MVLTRKFYFFTLTDSSVIVNSATRWTNQPGAVIAAFTRDAFPASNYNQSAAWRTFDLRFPNATRPTKLNVHPIWDGELDQLAAAFSACPMSFSGYRSPRPTRASSARCAGPRSATGAAPGQSLMSPMTSP